MESGFVKYTKTRLKRGLGTVRRSAKARGLPVDLDLETYKRLVEDPCAYCGHENVLGLAGGGLDRLDNDEGYYEENVVSCCGPCNRIRGDNLTVEEMTVAMEAVLEFRALQRVQG